jgi:hypothetical protein
MRSEAKGIKWLTVKFIAGTINGVVERAYQNGFSSEMFDPLAVFGINSRRR